MVYSTCSIAAEENEGVIDYILRKRFVKVVETGLPIDKEGITSYEDVRYDPRVKLTRRVYPHMHNMDGFYVAKLVKVKDGKKEMEGDAVVVGEKKEFFKPSKGMGKRDRLRMQGKLPKMMPKKSGGAKKSNVEGEVQGEKEGVAGGDSDERKVGSSSIKDAIVKRKLLLKKKLLEIKRKKV